MRTNFDEPSTRPVRFPAASPRWAWRCRGALSSACVYRINIQQGNFLDQAAVDQVKAGMTRSQVRYLLGTPMVADSFNKERWDYIYYLKKGRTATPTRAG